jgi:hypothetical protein
MSEIETEYVVNGKPTKFYIRRLKFGEYQKAMGSMSTVELMGGISRGKLDMTKLVDELMKASVRAEDGKTDFHELDVTDGLDLQAKVLEYNGMGSTPGTFREEAH